MSVFSAIIKLKINEIWYALSVRFSLLFSMPVDLLRPFGRELIRLQSSPRKSNLKVVGLEAYYDAGNQTEQWISFKIVKLINRMMLS